MAIKDNLPASIEPQGFNDWAHTISQRGDAAVVAAVQESGQPVPARPDALVVHWYTWDEPPISSDNPYDQWFEIPEILEDAVPDAFVASDWSTEATGVSGEIMISIAALPNANPDITDIEYRIDGGTAVSLNTTTIGDYFVSGLTNDVQVTVELRALNTEGAGAWSDVKSVTPTETTTTFETDFSEYTVGTTPNDMLIFGAHSPTVETISGAVGGVALQYVFASGTADRCAAVFDNSVADIETLSRMRTDQGSEDSALRTAVRAGADPTQNSYFVELRVGSNEVRIRKYVDGPFTDLDTASITLSANTWYRVRFRAIGTLLKAKVWEDGQSEPTTGGPDNDGFQLKATDSSFTSGTYGPMTFTPGTHEHDWFSAAFGGDTAPEVV